MCLLKCLVTCEGNCTTWWAILKVAGPIKENATWVARALTKSMYFPERVCALSRPIYHIFQRCSQTIFVLSVILHLHSPWCYENNWEKQKRAIALWTNSLFCHSFFFLVTEKLPVIIFEYSSLLECIESVLRSNKIGCQVNHSNYISCGRGMFLGYSLMIMTFFKTRKCSPSMEYRKLPELLSKS